MVTFRKDGFCITRAAVPHRDIGRGPAEFTHLFSAVRCADRNEVSAKSNAFFISCRDLWALRSEGPDTLQDPGNALPATRWATNPEQDGSHLCTARPLESHRGDVRRIPLMHPPCSHHWASPWPRMRLQARSGPGLGRAGRGGEYGDGRHGRWTTGWEAVVDEVAGRVAIRGAGSCGGTPTGMPAGAMVLVWQRASSRPTQGPLAVDAGRIDTASNGPLISRDGMRLHHRAGDGVHVPVPAAVPPHRSNRFLHSGFAPVLDAPEGLVATYARPERGPCFEMRPTGRARLACWASGRQLSLGMPRWPLWTGRRSAGVGGLSLVP